MVSGLNYRKIARSLVFAGLIVGWWYCMVSHYYEVLDNYAELKLWQTQPQIYIAVEWWLLFSLLVCTYLAIRLLDEVTA